MTAYTVSSVLGFVCGSAVIWFTKDWIQKLVIGASALSAKLRAKAAAVRAAV